MELERTRVEINQCAKTYPDGTRGLQPTDLTGAVASHAYLERLLEMTRAHGAYLFADECYSEIYLGAAKPAGIFPVAPSRCPRRSTEGT
eukprot:gene10455-13266_t